MSNFGLQFIVEGSIGPKERRLIRSHVMKGKNAGRPRPARTELRSSKRNPNIRQTIPPEGNLTNANALEQFEFERTLNLERVLWNDLTLTSFPQHVSLESRHFVYKSLWHTAKILYPPQFCSEVDLSQYVWFQYALQDKAYFQCLLAIAASFANDLGGTLKHISQVYKMINARLSGHKACSDEAIAVVTVLAIYQRMHQRNPDGLVHFNGLCKMIQLRGGLSALAAQNRILAQKPWRLDIEFALQDGSSPVFSLDDMSTEHCSLRFPLPQCESSTSNLYVGISPELIDLLMDITELSRLLNMAERGFKLDPSSYAESVIIRLHRLLHFSPLGHQRSGNALDNLVHISLVATMVTLLPEYGHIMAKYDLLVEKFRKTLWTYVASKEINDSILLWALFVGFVTILDRSDHKGLASVALETCLRLDLHSWTDVRSTLYRYAWIHVLYDTPGAKLWNMVETAK